MRREAAAKGRGSAQGQQQHAQPRGGSARQFTSPAGELSDVRPAVPHMINFSDLCDCDYDCPNSGPVITVTLRHSYSEPRWLTQ
jgi:hypothetical protein